MRWGAPLANDLIYANDFIRVPLFFLRFPKNLKSKLFRPPPLQEASKIFRPPFATRPNSFALPLNSKKQKSMMQGSHILGKLHYLRDGGGAGGSGGGEKFWTRREGGAKNFGRVLKGGRKILDASRRGGEKFQT